MVMTTLHVTNFRNLVAVALAPCQQGLNVISGSNGSGKTSLLEAIYYLGLGRSFRHSTAIQLIRHATDKFSIFAQLMNDNERVIPVGMERDRSGAMRLRVAEQNTSSITEIAYCLPLRLINSQSHGLFEAGPIGRRQYVDWGLFYQMTGFFDCWQHFGRTLKQRNAVLRDKRSKQELNVWTDKFVYYGCQLDQWRKEYIGQLIPILQSMVMELLDLTPLDVTYQSGWDSNMDLGTALARCYLEECRLGYTQSGPHRADLDVKIQGTPVKHRLSRGQQKLLVCAMILAQGVLLTHTVNKHLVYLIDDLPAELDKESTQRLVTLLSKQSTQVFMTAIESEVIRESLYSNIHIPVKVFHVKQGEIVTAGG